MATMPLLTPFLAGLDLVGAPQKVLILLVAYYMRRGGILDFSAVQLSNEFTKGHLPPPDNVGVRLSQLSRGKLAPLVRIGHGRYSLSVHGIQEVETYLVDKPGTALAAQYLGTATSYLTKIVGRLSQTGQRRFLAEAVACLRAGARRAAIIMTWLLVMDHLQEYVLSHKLKEFNTALASRKDVKGLQISTKDDFAELKEAVFIEALRSARIVTNDVRKILDEKLGVRNTAAHPADIEVHDTKVVNFVEDLVDNVVLKYHI